MLRGDWCTSDFVVSNWGFRHTGSRPAGLVFSAWGGTRVEAWMSTNAIADAAVRVAPPAVVLPEPMYGSFFIVLDRFSRTFKLLATHPCAV